MNKAAILLYLCCCVSFLSFGQGNNNSGGPEGLNPLRVNAELIKARKPVPLTSMKSPGTEFYFILDTLSLPFIDDFSRYSLKSYDTSKYPLALVMDSISFAFTVDGTPMDSFFCVADTTWSYIIDGTDSSIVIKDTLTEYEIVYYNDPYNPFVPTDISYCWSPFEVYDTLMQSSPDTIDTLGIIIDTLVNSFDSLKVYPPDSISLWIDEDAFINNRYPVNPITIGVATFDGVDEFGIPHNNFSDPSGYGVADFLTSKPIDLSGVESDSTYLSFYYQPQGIGNNPQAEDSLVLEFYAPSELAWHNIWSVPGTVVHNFRHVIVPVTDSVYLVKGFQFRFKNYATISGLMDHWHVDYVRLDEHRSAVDSVIVDVALASASRSVYKSFESVPWKHYLADTTLALADYMFATIRNLDSVVSTKTFYHYVISHDDGITDSSLIFPSGTNELDSPPQDTLIRRLPIDYYCSWSTKSDSASFEIMTALKPASKDVNSSNDTLRYIQNFYNYYAYDDGTAEASYYLNEAGGKLAYQFTTIIPDTLRAVDMYFAQSVDDQSLEFFYLTVWSSITPETIVYQEKFLTPVYEDSLNEFHTYLLDSIIVVSGTYYIGWVQETDASLNIGFDVNSDHSSKINYNVAGTWLQTILNGTIMMRPLFGDTVILQMSIEEDEIVTVDLSVFNVYPNPADDVIQIQLNHGGNLISTMEVVILDLYGREVVYDMNSSGAVDIHDLADGIYFVKVRTEGSNEFETKKIFVTH